MCTKKTGNISRLIFEMNEEKTKPVTAILIGAGTRGRDAYGAYAIENPKRLKFVAMADLDIDKRAIFQKQHNIADEMVFSSWSELLNGKIGKIADIAFICTPDRMHYEPAMKALEMAYDIFLEKPIAPTLKECQDIAALAAEKDRVVQVGHVLRFTKFWQTLKQFLETDRIGKIIHFDHSENVSYWHFGHSFVRGPYKNKDTSTPIVLAKTCHDLDLIYWLLNEKANEVYSTGELTHYRTENAPKESPERCTDGCPIQNECPWYAPRLYIDLEPILRIGTYSPSRLTRWITRRILKSRSLLNFLALFSKYAKKIKEWKEFPVTHITNEFSTESKMKALREGPYGLCIYKTGNDVVDHQISTFNFPSGATATLTMHGLSEHEGREFRLFGTKGVLRGIFRYNIETIEFTDFRYGRIETIFAKGLNKGGHGGGDFGILDAFTSVMLGEITREEGNLTDVFSAMESHFMGFAAEESRVKKERKILSKFRNK